MVTIISKNKNEFGIHTIQSLSHMSTIYEYLYEYQLNDNSEDMYEYVVVGKKTLSGFEDYIEVPDELKSKIFATMGYCDIVLNDEDEIIDVIHTPPEPDIDEIRESAIIKTHVWLNKTLEKGMTWIDGKLYNVTEKKQGYLQAQVLSGTLQVLNGENPENIIIRWNESGKSHVDWPYLQLCQLAMDIHAYVEPLVEKQQKAEEDINEASLSDIEEILKDFVI